MVGGLATLRGAFFASLTHSDVQLVKVGRRYVEKDGKPKRNNFPAAIVDCANTARAVDPEETQERDTLGAQRSAKMKVQKGF